METKTELPELTLSDRCDRCPAACVVEIEVAGLPLMFCGHHYNMHRAALENKAGAKVLRSASEWVTS